MKHSVFFLCALTILFSGAQTGLAVRPSYGNTKVTVPVIRVAILKGLRSLDIHGRDLSIRDLRSFQNLYESRTPSRVILKGEANGIRVAGVLHKTSLVSVTTTSPVLTINGKTYRGKLEIAREQDDTLTIINELDIEKYLIGLINHEISSAWNLEAVKAQAIVARTYAIFQKYKRQEDFYDMVSSVLDQVYGGTLSEDERARQAVNETRGLIVTYKGNPILALYHSSCGGRTESSKYFTGEDLPYLRGVSCQFCSNAPNYFWIYNIPLDKLAKAIASDGYRVGNITAINVKKRTPSHRAYEISIVSDTGTITIQGEKMRKAVGYDRLKSLNFNVSIRNNEAVFMGSGAGHGVGLCQWGMKGMADKGYTYKQILNYYYPGTNLKKLY